MTSRRAPRVSRNELGFLLLEANFFTSGEKHSHELLKNSVVRNNLARRKVMEVREQSRAAKEAARQRSLAAVNPDKKIRVVDFSPQRAKRVATPSFRMMDSDDDDDDLEDDTDTDDDEIGGTVELENKARSLELNVLGLTSFGGKSPRNFFRASAEASPLPPVAPLANAVPPLVYLAAEAPVPPLAVPTLAPLSSEVSMPPAVAPQIEVIIPDQQVQFVSVPEADVTPFMSLAGLNFAPEIPAPVPQIEVVPVLNVTMPDPVSPLPPADTTPKRQSLIQPDPLPKKPPTRRRTAPKNLQGDWEVSGLPSVSLNLENQFDKMWV